MRGALALACLAAVLSACGDLYAGRSGTVIEARVVRVVEEGERRFEGLPPQPFQRLELELEGGLYRGDRVVVPWGMTNAINRNSLLREGDRVLVSNRRAEDSSRQYVIEEVVRLPALAPFALALFAVLLAVARWKGVTALAGLAGSIAVFLLVVIPAVRRGDDPLLATLAGTAAILAVSVYVVHGLNRKSTAALLGTLGGLAVVAALAAGSTALARLSGLGSEETIYLVTSSQGAVDVAKLVLSGMIVGSLGALVDMSVGQSSATFELARVDPDLRGRELWGSALNVGRDHVGSLINTLALAYFGGTLPLVVLLSLGNAPLVLALNSETIVESVLAVLVASVGLVLCVPLTTAAAVALAGRR